MPEIDGIPTKSKVFVFLQEYSMWRSAGNAVFLEENSMWRFVGNAPLYSLSKFIGINGPGIRVWRNARELRGIGALGYLWNM